MTGIADADQYGREYFDGFYLNDQKRDKAYHEERDRIMQRMPHGGAILDIGCGIGGFLACMDDRWEKYGIEPSEYAAKKAEARGIRILRALNTVESESMDVVVFRGSLQHINFPMEAIVQAARVLKVGGLLVFLATPDTDSLVFRIWGRLPALDAPRNWVLFGGRTLANILDRLGFSVQIGHPYWGGPYANPPRDLWRFIVSLFLGWRPFAWPGNMMEVFAVKVKND